MVYRIVKDELCLLESNWGYALSNKYWYLGYISLFVFLGGGILSIVGGAKGKPFLETVGISVGAWVFAYYLACMANGEIIEVGDNKEKNVFKRYLPILAIPIILYFFGWLFGSR